METKSERNPDVAKALIAYYNHYSLGNIGLSSDANQAVVFDALDKVEGSISYLKDHIKAWLTNNAEVDYGTAKDKFKACFAEVELVEETCYIPDAEVNDGIAVLSKAIAKLVADTQTEKIEAEILNNLQNEVRNFIKKEYGIIERKVKVQIDDKTPVQIDGVLHEQFDTVLQLVGNDIPVFLTGPAGSGKNVICKQVAKALGLKFYFSNAVTQEYKLTGFTDANGRYQPTQFFKAFTEGGIFMLDEIDASIPEVLVILNAAIANKYFDFPAPIGYREAHPDFRVIAAGNTSGHGADYEYVGRYRLDGASIDRFALVEVGYSSVIEDTLAQDIDLADFCREFRGVSKKSGVNIIVSYRAIEHLAKIMKVMKLEDALKICLVKDMEKDDLNIILKDLHDSSYKRALKHLCSTL